MKNTLVALSIMLIQNLIVEKLLCKKKYLKKKFLYYLDESKTTTAINYDKINRELDDVLHSKRIWLHANQLKICPEILFIGYIIENSL